MGLPPGPRFVLPWIARYVVSPYRVFSALVGRYGDPVFMKLPDTPGTVATGHPQGVKSIITADAKTLVPWRVPTTVALLTEHSIFLQGGDAHKAVRKVLAPCFSPARHRHDCATMAGVVDAALDELAPGEVEIQPLAHRVTLDIILAALFGLRGGPRGARFHAAALRALDKSSPMFLYARSRKGRFARVQAGLEELKTLVQGELEVRRAETAAAAAAAAAAATAAAAAAAAAAGTATAAAGCALPPDQRTPPPPAHAERSERSERSRSAPSDDAQGEPRRSAAGVDARPPDMLDLLLRAKHPDGTPLSDREIQVHLSDMIVAGHETTTVAIAWTMYELCRHPGVMARLAADLDTHGPPRDLAALGKLPYLEAVCCEALRLHPPLAFLTRQTAKPLDIHGYDVPPGYGVSLVLPLIHTNPTTYTDPQRFRPERFLENTFGPDEFLPFGGGSKRCLGATFALQEMMIVVAGLVSRFRIRLARRWPIRPRARIITIEPVGGVPVVLERRAPRRFSAGAPAAPAPSAGRCPRSGASSA
jgi:cytochrome P450